MNIMKTLITWIVPLVLHTLSMELFSNYLNEHFQFLWWISTFMCGSVLFGFVFQWVRLNTCV